MSLSNVGRAQLGGAEIAAFDPKSDRAFVTDAIANALHIVDLAAGSVLCVYGRWPGMSPFQNVLATA